MEADRKHRVSRSMATWKKNWRKRSMGWMVRKYGFCKYIFQCVKKKTIREFALLCDGFVLYGVGVQWK
jgi:hypothetical protein